MESYGPRLSHLWRLFGGFLAVGLLAVFLGGCSTGSSYPSKAITVICPSGAGGASDLAVRPLADFLSKKWGQPVSVEDIAGAGGTEGTLKAIQAAPDGYTIATVANSQGTINPALESSLPYKWDQPTPIARFNSNVMVLTVKGDAKWNTAKEFVDAVVANPKGFSHATSSAAGPSTLGMAQLLAGAKVDASQVGKVVFNGGGPMVTALAGGNVNFIVGSVSEVLPMVQGKQLKALMVTSPDRLKDLPDVPTSKEAGYAWFNWMGYTGIWGAPKLPDAIVTKWSDSIKEACGDADFQGKLKAIGGQPAYLGPADFKNFLKAQYDETTTALKQLKMIQ